MPDGGIIGKVMVGLVAAGLFALMWWRGQKAQVQARDQALTKKAEDDVDVVQFEIEEAARKSKEESYKVDEWN